MTDGALAQERCGAVDDADHDRRRGRGTGRPGCREPDRHPARRAIAWPGGCRSAAHSTRGDSRRGGRQGSRAQGGGSQAGGCRRNRTRDRSQGSGRATGSDAHLASEGRPSASGAPARGRDLHGTASIAARLDELKPRLAQCYEGARSGANPPGGSPAPESERPVPPVFLLELESSGEHYRVVDANVDSRGGAEDAVLECMQTVLMNATIPTPGPETVDRVALRFSP